MAAHDDNLGFSLSSLCTPRQKREGLQEQALRRYQSAQSLLGRPGKENQGYGTVPPSWHEGYADATLRRFAQSQQGRHGKTTVVRPSHAEHGV